MDYTPNFNDPRVQARLKQAIKFASAFLRADKPQWLGTRYIDEHFGSQKHPLSKYLRKQLLVCVDDRYNKYQGKTKIYCLNQEGFDYLKGQLHTDIVQEVQVKFQQELEAGIEYKQSSDRKWHWIQSQRKEVKQAIYIKSGLRYNYDIRCAAPTLLLQYSQQLDDPMDLYLEYIYKYISDRKSIRQTIAQEADMHEQDVKILLNGILQGQHLSTYTQGTTYRLVEGDLAKIKFLQQHEFVVGFKQDVSVLWKYIGATMYRRKFLDKNRVIRTSPITSKQKSALYRRLELKVNNAVEQYLVNSNNQFVLEHDGWITRDLVNQVELVEFVRDTTGFLIGLDYDDLGASTSAH